MKRLLTKNITKSCHIRFDERIRRKHQPMICSQWFGPHSRQLVSGIQKYVQKNTTNTGDVCNQLQINWLKKRKHWKIWFNSSLMNRLMSGRWQFSSQLWDCGQVQHYEHQNCYWTEWSVDQAARQSTVCLDLWLLCYASHNLSGFGFVPHRHNETKLDPLWTYYHMAVKLCCLCLCGTREAPSICLPGRTGMTNLQNKAVYRCFEGDEVWEKTDWWSTLIRVKLT